MKMKDKGKGKENYNSPEKPEQNLSMKWNNHNNLFKIFKSAEQSQNQLKDQKQIEIVSKRRKVFNPHRIKLKLFSIANNQQWQ